MKEQLYMIPLNDAVNANDECPFCFIERQIEQDLMDFALGSSASYMERDVRDKTDRQGFCREHFHKMFQYGNALGNAWILKTHYMRMLKEYEKQIASYDPAHGTKKSLFSKETSSQNPVTGWVKERENSCYICDYYKEHYDRYLDTFFVMYTRDESFRSRIENGKGFCLTHFGDLVAAMETKLSEKERPAFYKMLTKLEQENLERLYEDVAWFIEKKDYKNQDADWKNSKDAIQRGMQKLKGGYPNDPVYKMKK